MATERKGESISPPCLLGCGRNTWGVPRPLAFNACIPGGDTLCLLLRHQAPPPDQVGFISLTTTRDLRAPPHAETISPTCPASSLCWRKRAAMLSRCVRACMHVALHYNWKTCLLSLFCSGTIIYFSVRVLKVALLHPSANTRVLSCFELVHPTAFHSSEDKTLSDYPASDINFTWMCNCSSSLTRPASSRATIAMRSSSPFPMSQF